MRDLKFRSWDEQTKSMVYFDLESVQRNLFSVRQIASRNNWSNPVMQFTGLYDKNGKEIYEGDVVDGYSGKYQLIFVQVTDTGYFFYWKPLEQCTESMTGFIDEYTVIGNIYENKDLLSN